MQYSAEKVRLNRELVSNPRWTMVYHRDNTVYLMNDELGLVAPIVDKGGKIYNFPGVDYSAQLVEELGEQVIDSRIRYQATFQKLEDKFRMVWTVRPDGWCLEDYGIFGDEDEVELKLYTYLDFRGRFLAPFRLYSVGRQVVEDVI